jgi:transposase
VFIRVTKNAAGQGYYHLVESYREGGKVKQRTLLSLGRVEDDKLDELAEAIAKHKEIFTAANLAKSMSVDQTFVLGPLLVLRELFKTLGIDHALGRLARDHAQLGFNVREVVFGLVAARLVRPTSKLAVYEQLHGQFYPDGLKANPALHQVYRAIDMLAAGKDNLETDLFMHGRDLFSQNVDVVLYDLTTLRFESTAQTEELRRFGYSKDRRSDCTQVVLGLLTDTLGMPLGFEVFPGNTFEGKTLESIIDKMHKKFRVRRFVFVADRGLLSKPNLKIIKQAKGEFIVGMRIGALDKKRPELYDRSKFTQVSDGFEFLETTFDGDRGIVTWSRDRAERDKKVRDDILDKIRKKLKTGRKKASAKDFISNTNYRFFLKGLDKGKVPEIDEDKVAQAARKDGFFAIVSNVPKLLPAELFAQYKELWRIEDCFGELKGTLKARPIFHWTDHRIVGHLTLCFIAFLCEAHIIRALRAAEDDYHGRAVDANDITTRQLSAVVVLRELAEVRAVPVTVGTKTHWLRTDIKGHVATLFKRLGMRIPPKLLKTENVVAQTIATPAT